MSSHSPDRRAKAAKLTFLAEVHQVQTLADGGLRVQFDLPETAIAQCSVLMELKRQGVAIQVEVKALK